MQTTVLMALLALLLSFTGFAALCLAMDRHQEPVLGRVLTGMPNHGLRAVGAVMLVLALTACLAGQAQSIAVAVWLGLMTFAAFAVAAMLSYFPRALLPASGMALVAATAMALLFI